MSARSALLIALAAAVAAPGLGCRGANAAGTGRDAIVAADEVSDASPPVEAALEASVEDAGSVEIDDVAADDASTDEGAPAECPAVVACDAPFEAPARAEWRHAVATRVTVALGAPQHRGRDLFYASRDPQWLIGKFAYGVIDDDLEDEDVDVYVLRGCAGPWERLGTARTTRNNAGGPAIEGVPDTGGRVYFAVPSDRRLAVGWHRVRFVVRGDQSSTDAMIEVLGDGARVVVTDVDGTLTESENAEFFSTLTGGAAPEAHPGAAAALATLARRGFHVMYLTARPEFVVERSRAWLRSRGFPLGVLHTTTGTLPLVGAPAERFKVDELEALVRRIGGPPAYAFGNRDTDVAAYAGAGVEPARSYYYQLAGDLRGGVRLDDYRTLLRPFAALAPDCR